MREDHYEGVKAKYGSTSSWAIYDEDYGDYYRNFRLIEDNVSRLKPHFIFCALNSSRETLRIWETFHVRYQGGKGAILRDTFNNSPVFIGSYMTDLIKFHINPKSGEVVENINGDKELLAKNLNSFQDEVQDLSLGNPVPVIFAIGGTVFNLLANSPIVSRWPVEQVTHYSAYGRDTGKFRKEIQALESRYSISVL